MSWIKDKLTSIKGSGKGSPKKEPTLDANIHRMRAESLRESGPLLSGESFLVDDHAIHEAETEDESNDVILPLDVPISSGPGSNSSENMNANDTVIQDELPPNKIDKSPAARVLLMGRKRKEASSKSQDAGTVSSHGRKQKKVESVALGLTLNNADFWLKLYPNGDGENLNIAPSGSSNTDQLDGVPVFRLTNYDKGLLLNKKLRGKALRNAMLREKEISDVPASFAAYGLRWFTRKSSVQVEGQPVHPLGTSLWTYAKKKGWNPEKGTLLYTGIRAQNYMVWIYLALGKNGIGVPQVANINAEADRPAFNMAFSGGLLIPKEYETHHIPPEELFQWLSTGNHKTYPQPGEWLGQSSRVVGKGAMIFGLTTCVVGAGVWWVGNGQLLSAKQKMHKIEQKIDALRAEKVSFLKAHLPEIAYSFNIPLTKDIRAAETLWKPGTQVIMADGLPLGVGANSNAPAIQSAGAMQQTNQPAQIAVTVPITKNLGNGQASWVSPRILYSVISQKPADGFSLQSITHNTMGGGYVVIFNRGR